MTGEAEAVAERMTVRRCATWRVPRGDVDMFERLGFVIACELDDGAVLMVPADAIGAEQ